MHLFLAAEDSALDLRAELAESFSVVTDYPSHPFLLGSEFPVEAGQAVPCLVFARQWLPDARPMQAESVRVWAGEVFSAIAGVLPDHQPWSLHIEPEYGGSASHRIGARAWHSARRLRAPDHDTRNLNPPANPAGAGQHRCRLVREALIELLQKKRRHLLRSLRSQAGPFAEAEALVQVLLTAPETGFLSVARAPLPREQRRLLSFFPKGEAPSASDKAAPSRAFAKLVEAEMRLGTTIWPGETCVDLGAAPGSWTYTAANRGARVIAVDRSPLRDDLMRSRHVEFTAGDAFRFKPGQPADWLLCDVIAAPEKTAQLLLEWLRRRWCRHFVVTLKLKDAPGTGVLTQLKRELPALTCEYYLTRLCANKKEVCVFGTAEGISDIGRNGLTPACKTRQ